MNETLCSACGMEAAETSKGQCWTCDIVQTVGETDDLLADIGEFLATYNDSAF